MNILFLIGRVGNDPETTTTGGGTKVTKFSLATSERMKAKDGTREERTVWHRVVCFGVLAEMVFQYVNKGRQVAIVGRQENGSYEKDGRKVYTSEVIADRVEFLGSKSDGRGSSTPASTGAGEFADDFPQHADDDVPF